MERDTGMTTLESYKKFGLETDGAMGGILMIAGSAIILLGLVVTIVDQFTGDIGLEGWMLLLFMILFFGPGFALLFTGIRKFRKDKVRVDGLREAYENNRCIMADIVGIHSTVSSQETSNNMFTGVHYREHYNVECRYMDAAGVTHIYYSPALYFDPTDLITAKQVPIYIDQNNEKNFFVDSDQAMTQVKVHW